MMHNITAKRTPYPTRPETKLATIATEVAITEKGINASCQRGRSFSGCVQLRGVAPSLPAFISARLAPSVQQPRDLFQGMPASTTRIAPCVASIASASSAMRFGGFVGAKAKNTTSEQKADGWGDISQRSELDAGVLAVLLLASGRRYRMEG